MQGRPNKKIDQEVLRMSLFTTSNTIDQEVLRMSLFTTPNLTTI